ncbi:MAG TPA: CTP synthase [Candidatus Azosocius sp. HAIN]
MSKYIFVTGGVVSSLGKGLTSSVLGSILELRKIKITILKLDPYININSGTMSPFQHGEVYVTNDGSETDLDLGHYERFITTKMNKYNHITAGQIYHNVISKERSGTYLGATIQVIPHITDEIKKKIYRASKDFDISIIEIGGTVGDIESLPFLEAIRQLRIKHGNKNTLFLHLTLIPWLKSIKELKTKPTQHSVKELRSIGIQPDILICRSNYHISSKIKEKIAMFTNVEKNSVFWGKEVSNIYQLPIFFHKEGLDKKILDKLDLKYEKINLFKWKNISNKYNNNKKILIIGIVGKYIKLCDSYKSLSESLYHAGLQNDVKIKIKYINSEKINYTNFEIFKDLHGILIPGGFGKRGINGKIVSSYYSRKNNIPFLGICLGLQMAIIEYSRNIGGIINANSTEIKKRTNYPIIALIKEWLLKNNKYKHKKYEKNISETMRLGNHTCFLIPKTKIYNIYNKKIINERHRHRYEVNNILIPDLEKLGIKISGWSKNLNLVETIELNEHFWYICCQFHPEFNSNPESGHPIFNNFILSSLKYKENKKNL